MKGDDLKMKQFCIAGNCIPEKHYMVDVSNRLNKLENLIINDTYFIINRPRQFGKTTTLKCLMNNLRDKYYVVFLDMQFILKDDDFINLFITLFYKSWVNQGYDKDLIFNLYEKYKIGVHRIYDLVDDLDLFCKKVDRPIVLLIDEIDCMIGNQCFIDFLSIIRGYYIQSNKFFKSIILSGVQDIINLKIKMHSNFIGNSPWNIAYYFDDDMGFSLNDITGMLSDYSKERGLSLDIEAVSSLIYDYTNGYPVLVSFICKLIDEKYKFWNKDNIIKAVHYLINSKYPLIESLRGKLELYPELFNSLSDLLFRGKSILYNPIDKSVCDLEMFGFIIKDNNEVKVYNRIFETILYDSMLLSNKKNLMLDLGDRDKDCFIKSGVLDVEEILKGFINCFNDIYGNVDNKFIEEDGRKCFLLYLRPIINDYGNYYIEAQTRNRRRTDIIIDYAGQQFIIELKIWRGLQYHHDGELQLADYLEYYHLNKGYLLTFDTRKEKKTGVDTIMIKNKTIVEAFV